MKTDLQYNSVIMHNVVLEIVCFGMCHWVDVLCLLWTEINISCILGNQSSSDLYFQLSVNIYLIIIISFIESAT